MYLTQQLHFQTISVSVSWNNMMFLRTVREATRDDDVALGLGLHSQSDFKTYR